MKRPAVLMPFIADRVFGWTPITIDEKMGLKSIDLGKAYTLVNSCFCNECAFLYLDMRFDEEENKILYDNYRGSEYNKLRIKYEPDYELVDEYLNNIYPIKNRINTENYISKFIKIPDNILDWGGGDGRNTPFNDVKNKNIDIYEISDLEKENYSNINFIKNIEKKYELITCLHMFEHLSYPLKMLEIIGSYLCQNGFIYIEVPYEKIMRLSKEPINNKNHWHEHVNFFSIRSLEALISHSNFEIIDLRSEDISDEFRDFHIIRLLAKIKNNLSLHDSNQEAS
jgi:hypothetical protein